MTVVSTEAFVIILLWEYNKTMLKTIYHGSDKIIEKPLFGHGKTYNDYGLGFYCTEVKKAVTKVLAASTLMLKGTDDSAKTYT